MFTKTRIAPTPSGFLHLGNLYSFLLTARLAQESNASLLLRIDDMDRERVRPDYIEDIFDNLKFFGIAWTEGPVNAEDFEKHHSQLHRLELYNAYLGRLQQSGKVFACNCSRTDVLAMGGVYNGHCRNKNIPLNAQDVCWRLMTEKGVTLEVKTNKGEVLNAHLPEGMTDFVVRKKDGFPAYQLCSLADDNYYQVDCIVRGSDLWDSTLAQLYLAKILGETRFQEIEFCHHALLKTKEGTKLSKSSGDTSLRYLREQGWSREEIVIHLQSLAGASLYDSD